MYSLLLKKAIPFALTFVIGSFVGGLFKFFVPGAERAERPHAYFYGYGEGRSGCKHARQRYLVAESKPLTILFKPDARWPAELRVAGQKEVGPVTLSVTFGSDGKVRDVNPAGINFDPIASTAWHAAERTARQIQFEPETVNGLPVTVTRDVEIHFMADCEVMKPNEF
jgi:hypothetical protein